MVMRFSLPISQVRGALVQYRASPISATALMLTIALGVIGVVSSIATGFTFASLPDVMPLLVGIVGLDVLSRFAPQTRIVHSVQTLLYGVLFFAVTCLFGVLAAYSLQRFAFPLEDHFLLHADLALGLNWFDFAHWVDRHALVQNIFYYAYHSLSLQIALPLLFFSLTHRPLELRRYLLAFAIAFTATIIVSAMMPAAGPIGFIDTANFHLLKFSGATPVDQLMRLRVPGPWVMNEAPGGIATFPSFHATIAILTPLTMRRYPRLFAGLVALNAAMLGAAVTEGAHYFIDILAGSAMAVFAYMLAGRIIKLEDRWFLGRAEGAERPYATAQVTA